MGVEALGRGRAVVASAVGGLSVPYAYRVYPVVSFKSARITRFCRWRRAIDVAHGARQIGSVLAVPHGSRQPEQVDPAALSEAVEVLMTMMQRGPPVSSGGPALSIPYVPFVLPGMLVWGLIGLGIGVGLLVGLPAWRTAIGGLGWASVAGVVAGVVAVVPALTGPCTDPWRISLSGYGGWCALGALVDPFRKTDVKQRLWSVHGCPRALCNPPLLALPWALMAVSCALSMRLWPMLFLVLPFPLFLTSGDLWRELVFHGVLPGDPLWWLPLKCLAMWPVACVVLSVQPARSRFFHVAAGLLLVALCSLLFLSDPFAGTFFERGAPPSTLTALPMPGSWGLR